MLAVSSSKPLSIHAGNAVPASCYASSGHAVSPNIVSSFKSAADAFDAEAPAASSGASLPKSMTVSDRAYGSFTITEPVLIDLLHSEPIHRLRSVLQHGITGLIGLTPQPAVTRHEHSVGAMMLVRAAGGSVEAQASALLHDIAHTALSHVIDGVFGYVVHEDDKMEYLNDTAIPSILTKHGFDAAEVLDEVNYPLLELDAPAICADRLDYGIRDSLSFGFLTLEEASAIQKDLTVSNKQCFAFKTAKWAKTLSLAYMKSDNSAWSNETHSVLYQYAAEAISCAYKSGLMKKSQLWAQGDKAFWASMVDSPSEEVRKLAAKVRVDIKVQEVPQEQASEEDMHWTAKVRTLDPDVVVDAASGETRRLSEIDSQYKATREAYINSKYLSTHNYRNQYAKQYNAPPAGEVQ